jgi:hypothetical protein
MYKKASLFILVLFCIVQKSVYSKTYHALTKSNHIDAELTTFSREEMNHYIGFSKCLFGWMSSEDRVLLAFLEKCTLVKVRIKNKSSRPVFLKKDEYILGIDDIFVPREELLSWYKVIRPLCRNRALAQSFFTVFAGGLAAASVVEGVKTKEKPFFMLSTLMGLVTCGIGLFAASSINEYLAIKRQETFFKLATNKIVDSNMVYQIDGNDIFEDLFFVYTSAVREGFFDKNIIELETC